MTDKYEVTLTPTYVEGGRFYAAAACRAGALAPGPVEVIAPGVAQPRQYRINSGFGISGLRPLYSSMQVKAGDVITYTVSAPNTITILSHHRASINETPDQVESGDTSVPNILPPWMVKRLRYRKLQDEHQQFIAQEIARLIPVAANQGHSWRTARFLIDSLLWCWTADGIDADGDAGRDKLKYDCMRQLHTVKARERWEQNKGKGAGLRHEHAVPRKQLIKWMLDRRPHPTADEVQAFLCRLCFAVVITVDEDRQLKPYKDSLPDDWDWNAQGDARLLRYEKVGLLHLVRPPELNE